MTKTHSMIVVCLMLLLSSCISKYVTFPSSFPTQKMLTQGDLPAHWFRVGGEDDSVEGAVASHVLGFEYRPKQLARILSQHLSIYKDGPTAVRAYRNWLAKYYPTEDWESPENFIFKPKNKTDQFDFRCMEGEVKVNEVSQGKFWKCRSIQQHDKYISLMMANIDEHTLTMKEFEQVLSNSDADLHNDKIKP